MIVSKEIEKYIEQHSTPEDTVLAELNRETYLKAINPRMLSGKLQGRFLEMISKIINPTNILEIGTFTGYSGICLARGMKKGGHLHTIECNDEIIRFPEKYFQKAGISDSATIHHGDAIEIIPTLKTSFDLVFIDADKKQYLNYFELCFNKIQKGGVILTDNVLWDGKVLQNTSPIDDDTKAILDFNRTISSDKRVEVIILPLRDGISIIRKL